MHTTYGRDLGVAKTQRAEFSAQMHQLFGGDLRWFCTVLFLLSFGFATYLSLTTEVVEVYFPLRLKGQSLLRAITLAALVFGALGGINWYSWLKNNRKP